MSFERTDIVLPGAPESVALGDLDGRNGQDIVMAFPGLSTVGVMLNRGDGTFAAPVQHAVGSGCAAGAVDITLGDVTPASPDGKLDAFIACTPNVVRLTGDGAGALGNPTAFPLNLPPYLGPATIDFLALMRRAGDPAPLLVLQHGVGSFGRELCVSFDLDGENLICNSTGVQGPLVVGDLIATAPSGPPDEIVTAEAGDKLGVFGFAPAPSGFYAFERPAPGGVESAALGDLDRDGDLDVLVGRPVNSLNAREPSIRFFTWDAAAGLAATARTLPSTPGVDAVAVADVDRDGCNDVVAAGTYGTGMIHLGDGAGNFDGGRDLPQLGYQNPGTSTRVTLAVGDLNGDGRPDLVVSDQSANRVMVYRNTSPPSGPCYVAPPAGPIARDDTAAVAQGPGGTGIYVLANDDAGAVVASVTQPAHGTTQVAGLGEGVGYTPHAGYCNDLGGGVPDTFTYTLVGGSTATVTVIVQCAAIIAPVVVGPAVVPPAPTPVPPPPPRTCTQPGTTSYIIGTPGADVLVGTNLRDTLSGRAGDDCLFGRGGDDRLTGGTGNDLLDGSGGDDRLTSDAGDDKIRGGIGNDTITPGEGKDTVAAQGGNDEIFARDGARDTIDCGAGQDKVTINRGDKTKNCERVKLR